MDCEECLECGKDTENCRCGGEEKCVICPLLHKGGSEPKCVVRPSKDRSLQNVKKK